jgi:prophage regulatory protein
MEKMLRVQDVVEATGLSRTTIWRKLRAGTFPPPFELSENAIGWPEAAIIEWRSARQLRTYGDQSADGLPGAA